MVAAEILSHVVVFFLRKCSSCVSILLPGQPNRVQLLRNLFTFILYGKPFIKYDNLKAVGN